MVTFNKSRIFRLAWLLLVVLPGCLLGEQQTLNNVSISQPFFNPSLNQLATISFSVASPGVATIQIIDRDGYVVRTFPKQVKPGSVAVDWDGRNQAGRIVPNEAYSIRILLIANGKQETYFPANMLKEISGVPATYYDRENGILSYQLGKPSRVHILAGSFKGGGKSDVQGPVLKTIANREPRTSGSIIEYWNGFDESGTIKVSELPNFAISIVAERLPENSVITIGNSTTNFVEEALKRKGQSLFTFAQKDHRFHAGLNSLQDSSPKLKIESVAAAWTASEQTWSSQTKMLQFSCSLEGPNSRSFARLSGMLTVYIDDKAVVRRKVPPDQLRFDLPATEVKGGLHIVAVNWDTDYGPVAVNSFRWKFDELSAHASGSAKGVER